MKKLFTKISLLFAGLMLCAGNAWADDPALVGEKIIAFGSVIPVNVKFQCYDDNTATVVQAIPYGVYAMLGEGIEIPSEIEYNEETYTVTKISEDAFSNCQLVVAPLEYTFVIPSSITYIGDRAFKFLAVAEGATVVFKVYASSSCFVGNNVFDTEKSTIQVQSEGEMLGIMMYIYMTGEGKWGNYASIIEEMPADVISTPQEGYEFTADNVEYRIEGSMAGIYMLTIIGADGYSDAELDLPQFITTIPGYEGTYYASIFSIAEEAFKDNTHITSVTIPSNVHTIGARAFQGCSNLTSITYTGTAAITIGENAFATGNSNTRQNVSFSDENTVNTDARLAAYAGTGIKCNVTIQRPIQKGNQYNTLCLPFSLSAAEIASSALAGVEVYEFANATKDGEYLDLHFRPVTSIEAGMPYFIRFAEEGANLTSLVFEDVTLVPDAQSVTHGDATLHGLLSEASLSGSNKLYLAANNELHWYDYGKTVYPFRAYFEVAGGLGAAPKARIVAHENAATGIEDVAAESKAVKFVENGQILIKRGEAVYNLQGQVVK